MNAIMLVILQFPLADCRFLIENDTGKLALPSWPSPEPERDFIRSFGGVRMRYLGGLLGFGESEICSARRAVRLPGIPVFQTKKKTTLTSYCAFRRIYADGLALVKYELGLKIFEQTAEEHLLNALFISDKHPICGSHIKLNTDSLNQLLIKFLQMEAVIPLLNGRINTTLGYIQNYLPQLYLQNTTKTSFLRDNIQPEWWVSAANPLILIETQNESLFKPSPMGLFRLPSDARTISVKNDQPLKLCRFHLRNCGRTWPVWFISHSWSYSADTLDNARTLRLQLLRLNAENQCLRVILRTLDKHKADITIKRGTTASELLQRFLRDSLRKISRSSNKINDLAGRELEYLARTSIDALNPGQRDELLEYIRQIGIRHNVFRNVESYAQNWTKSGEIIMKQTNVHADQGQVIVIEKMITDKIENSFNQAVHASMNDALKDEFSKLRLLVSEMLKTLPKDQADTVARDFSDLTHEATSPKPRRSRLEVTGQGLIEAAKTCAELVAPITKVVKAIISLCVL